MANQPKYNDRAYLQYSSPVLPMDKTMSQLATVTSSSWNTEFPNPLVRAETKFPNYNGVLPPSPTTILNCKEVKKGTPYQLFRIQSRDPYAAEYMATPYGGMQTRVGTTLGFSK